MMVKQQTDVPWKWGHFPDVAVSFIIAHSHYQNIAIISDETVFQLYGEMLRKELAPRISSLVTFVFPPGENSKTLETVAQGWEQLIEAQFDRQSLLIALGGGVVSDIAGFIAATYMRGIDVVHVPTSLEAMVDAALGGKNGFNWKGKKNLIGTFHLPKQIWLDVNFLTTLPDRDFRAGLAEVIKYGVIADPAFFEYLEENAEDILEKKISNCKILIEKSCQVKHHMATHDVYDRQLRMHLNYGHTFGHAIEAMKPNEFKHGEAVAIGMSCAAHLGVCLGQTQRDFVKRQDALCKKLGLTTTLPEMSWKHLIEVMKHDKKAVNGNLSFIVPQRLGKVCRIENVSNEMVLKALANKVNSHECN